MPGTLPNVSTRRHRRFFDLRSLATLPVGTRRRISSRETFWPSQTENRARVDAKELAQTAGEDGRLQRGRNHALAMKLMAYTFVRTSEEIEAPWSEFDLDEARWTIPAERMKMKTPHIVPLSRQAVEVLRALKQITGNGKFVFPGARDKKKPISNNTILYALYRLGYRDRMTGHGFRGLASTILNEHGSMRRISNCSSPTRSATRWPRPTTMRST
jgi:integrase